MAVQYNLLLLNILLYSVVFVKCQSDSNNLEKLFNEIDNLARQQLEQLQTTSSTTTTTTSPPRSSENASSNQPKSSSTKKLDQFHLPPGYDPKKAPKFSKLNPIVINVDLTVLDASIDKHENVIVLDMKIKESWKDRRFRIKKNDNDKSDQEDDYDYSEDSNPKKMESHLLEGEWLSNIWHPVSRLRNNAHVTNALFDKPKQALQKTIEQEKLIENILIMANASTAYVWITLKMRVNIPIYECKRDDSRLYPFDKIHCSFHITNALYDKRTLVYKWHQVQWDHNEYHSGQFYLRELATSIANEPIIEIDESGSEHSVMKIDFMLKRQIGDYILNIYVLHIFLLILCVSTYWISIQNIVIRMSLTIIILIIIKFQTFQTLKDEQRIVSALSIWTFGLSCLVILCILCHILSYYSFQHKWNDKILNRLVQTRPANTTTQTAKQYSQSNEFQLNSTVNNNNNINISNVSNNMDTAITDSTTSLTSTNTKLRNFKKQWNKWKRNFLLRLNSIIVNRRIKNNNQNYDDDINLVDIIARIALIIIYSLFVVIYFFKYAI